MKKKKEKSLGKKKVFHFQSKGFRDLDAWQNKKATKGAVPRISRWLNLEGSVDLTDRHGLRHLFWAKGRGGLDNSASERNAFFSAS